jgi:hypothetical protein
MASAFAPMGKWGSWKLAISKVKALAGSGLGNGGDELIKHAAGTGSGETTA